MNKKLNVYLAGPRGFCAGVDRAIEMVKGALNKYGKPVYVRHEIVHNKYVVDSLKSEGAIFVEDLNEIADKSRPVIFSAHGVPKSVPEEASKLNLLFFDATCPLVHKIHQDVKDLYEDGRKIIVIGDHGHDEVVAIADQVPRTIVVSSVKEAEQINRIRKAGVVTQSTQAIENVQDIIKILKSSITDGVLPVPPTYILPTHMDFIFSNFFFDFLFKKKLLIKNGNVNGSNKKDNKFGLLKSQNFGFLNFIFCKYSYFFDCII